MLAFFVFMQTIPIGSSWNLDLEYLEGRGLINLDELRPYSIEDIAFELSNLTTAGVVLSRYESFVLRKMGPFIRDNFDRYYVAGLHGRYSNEPENYYLATRLLFSGRIVDRLRYSNRCLVQYAKTIDDSIPFPWRQFQFFIEDALLRYRYRNLTVEVGRKEILFGPGRTGGLLMSNSPGSYDGLLMRLNTGPLYFTTTFSMLGSNRYLALHRLDLTKGRSSIGFSEVILFGGKFEPMYLNPLIPYYVSQWNVKRDDNIMWAFDGKFFIRNFMLYGEFLIDDYRFDTVPPAPNKLGYLAGLRFFAGGLIAGFEYVRLDKWVYTQRKPVNTYAKDDKCVGHWLGPDADYYNLTIDYRMPFGLNLQLSPALKRKGVGTIDLSWEEEEMQGASPKPLFPSGVVETTKEIGMTIEYNPSLMLGIKLNLKRLWIDNEDHVRDRNTVKNIIDLSAQIGI